MFVDAWNQALEQFETLIADVITFLPTLLVGVLVGLITFMIAVRIRNWGRRIAKRTNAPLSVETLIVNTMYITALLIATMITLGSLGVNVAALVAGLGVGGIIVGYALKDILENFLAGALILIQRPFDVGEAITVSGHTGVVTQIKLRDTRLRNFENLEIIIPNRTVYNADIINYGTYNMRRRGFGIGLGYSNNLQEDVRQIIDVVKGVEGVSGDEEPMVRLEEFGDSSINGKIFYTVKQNEADYFAVHTQVIIALQQLANELGIDIPYPHVQVLLPAIQTAQDAAAA